MTVVGDNSVSDYTRELHCPVLLRGASFGEERGIPKIFIKRTMEERGTCTVHTHMHYSKYMQFEPICIYM